PGIGRVLQHAVGIDDGKAVVFKLQPLTVHHLQRCRQPGLRKILLRQLNGAPGEVNARYLRSAASKTNQVSAHPTADFQQPFLWKTVEVDQPWQVVQLFKTVVSQLLKELWRANGAGRDFQIVDAFIPVIPHLVYQSLVSQALVSYCVALCRLNHSSIAGSTRACVLRPSRSCRCHSSRTISAQRRWL